VLLPLRTYSLVLPDIRRPYGEVLPFLNQLFLVFTVYLDVLYVWTGDLCPYGEVLPILNGLF
jgi:hypothetical protein